MAMQSPERSVRRCHKRKRSSSAGSEADANNDDQVEKFIEQTRPARAMYRELSDAKHARGTAL